MNDVCVVKGGVEIDFSKMVELVGEEKLNGFWKILAAKISHFGVKPHQPGCLRTVTSRWPSSSGMTLPLFSESVRLRFNCKKQGALPATQLVLDGDGDHCKLGVHLTSDAPPSNTDPAGHDRDTVSPIS